MTLRREIARLKKTLEKTRSESPRGYFAVLGKLDGTILTGTQNIVYVTTFSGEVKEVLNRRVPSVPGSVVFVGTDKYSANKVEILYTLNATGSSNDGASPYSSVLPFHDHSYPAANTTWVWDSQFLPLLALPIAGTLTIQIYPGAIRKRSAEGYINISDQTVDVSGDVPGSGACWITLQANNDGSVDYVVGETAADRESLLVGDIPDSTTGLAICAVVLEAGATALSRNNSRNDFLDLRFSHPTHAADEVSIEEIPTATYDDVQDFINQGWSSGWLSGMTLSDGGGATVDIAAGTGFIATADDQNNRIVKTFDYAGDTTTALADGTTRYIFIQYNSGSPTYSLETTRDQDEKDQFLIGWVTNDGGTLHIINAKQRAGGIPFWLEHYLQEVHGFIRADALGGVSLGEDGSNRYVTVTEGEFYFGLNEFPIVAVDTNPGGGADTMTRYYPVSGVWTKQTGLTAWPNTEYSDGTDLQTMTTNRYGNIWVYLDVEDNEVVLLYGTSNEALQANVEEESPPATLPDRVSSHCVLIGRFVFQKNASSAVLVQSAFDTQFTGSGSSSLAVNIQITDTGGYYTGTNAEAALQEIGNGTTLDGRYVNVTGDTMTGALIIDGSSDTQQLIVQANATQTANLQEWQRSGGSVLSYIGPKGNIVTALTADGTYNYAVNGTIIVPSGVTGQYTGIYGVAIARNNVTIGTATYVSGVWGTAGVQALNSNAVVSYVDGIKFALSFNANSGYIAQAAVWASTLTALSPAVSGAGTFIIPNAYGMKIQNHGNSNITQATGIYIDAQTGSATNWAIYTNAGDIRLMASGSDKISFHGSAPVAQQTVTGSRGGNVALADLLTKLANIGLIVDGSS